MNWTYPLTPSTITGRQLLTEAKPITAIYRAVKELQDSVVAGGEIEINGVFLDCSVVGNVLRASGSIPFVHPTSALKELTVLTGVTPTLTAADNRLTLTLSFTAKTIDFANGKLLDVTVPDAVCYIDGREDCPEE